MPKRRIRNETRLETSTQSNERRKRLLKIAASLPEAEALPCGSRNEHLAIQVRKKTFAYYMFDHHGDGLIALACKAAPGAQSDLVREDPRTYFVPAYLGSKGWVGARLDLPRVNWNQVAYLLQHAYRMSAPRALSGPAL